MWASGLRDWDEYLAAECVPGVGKERKLLHDRELAKAREALDGRDLRRLSALLSPGEAWRFYGELGKDAVFLDIETTGLGRDAPVTVVGLFQGRRRVSLVRGQGLNRARLKDELKDASMLVTFNGAGFDLPILALQFPGSLPKVPHLDLRFTTRKVGLSGGLKKVERALGIGRREDVQGMSGEDAVRMWHMWERDGNRNALRLLVDYNMADVVNLKPLADVACGELERRAMELMG